MKRILILAILILIAILFLYAAYLDGVVAFAEEESCKFCDFLESHNLEADTQFFPQTEIGSMKSIDYELVLNARLIFGHDRSARRALVRGIEFRYCPECGRKIG